MLRLAAEAVAVCSDAKDDDDFYMWEPFFHIGGAQVLLLPLVRNVTLTISDRFSASRFWDELRKAGSTHIHHLGGIIQILLKQPPSEKIIITTCALHGAVVARRKSGGLLKNVSAFKSANVTA